jgi:hypothetical protein
MKGSTAPMTGIAGGTRFPQEEALSPGIGKGAARRTFPASVRKVRLI